MFHPKLICINLSRSNVPIPSFDPIASTTSSTGPSYSAAYLNELKAATPSSRPRLTGDEPVSYDVDASMDANSYTPQIVDLTGELSACFFKKLIDNTTFQ